MSDFLSLAMFPALIGLIITGFPIAFSIITGGNRCLTSSCSAMRLHISY